MSEATPQVPSGRERLALVWEDCDPVLAAGMARSLAGAGHTLCDPAPVPGQPPPDLFLVRVTDAAGLARARALAGERAGLVILTPGGDPELARACLEGGVDDYVVTDPGGLFLEAMPLRLARVLERRRLNERSRRAISRLERSEKRLRSYFESSVVGMAVASPDRRWVEVNDALCDMLGYAREEVLGMGWEELTHPEDVTFSRSMADKLYGGELSGYEIEKRYLRKDGRALHVNLSVRAVADDAGALEYVMTLATDVSRRVASEEKSRLAVAEARQAERVKSEFLANMSHEIRTPMNSILGMAALALESSGESKDRAGGAGDCREYLEAIHASAEALLYIVDDILDFSKIEAGKIKLEERVFDLERTVKSILWPLGLQAEQKGLNLSVDLEEGVGGRYRGDPVRLGQILLNLAGNAVKFTRHGGVDILFYRDLDDGRGLGPGRRSLVLAVRDTGVGIPRDKLERIFDSFTQADGSTTRVYGGTGLGLTITKRLVELLGGRTRVESEEGQGSTFFITLPMDYEGPSDEPPSGPRIPGSARPGMAKGPESGDPLALPPQKVLLAEDSELNARIIHKLLTDRGHEVTLAVNGREVVDAVRRASARRADVAPFDLVLMDISMPVMDGLAATRAVRAMPDPVGSMPIVALTAHAMRGDRERFLAEGMDGYVPKPVRFATLFEAMAQAIKGDRKGARMVEGERRHGGAPASPASSDGQARSAAQGVTALTLPGDAEIKRDYGLDNADLVDLRRDLLEDVPVALRGLAEAVSAQDMEAVAETAHKLAGSSLGILAPDAADSARILEASAMDGNTFLVPYLFEDLRELVEAAVEATRLRQGG